MRSKGVNAMEPVLRFPAFSGAWKATRIGEIADLYKGKNIAKRKLPTAKKQSNSLPVFCLDCSKEISNKGAVRCVSCSGSNHSKIEWPDLAKLQAAVADYPAVYDVGHDCM